MTTSHQNGTVGTNCCTARWSGANTCHCTVCHQTFTGITAFDAHRIGSFTESGETAIDRHRDEPRGPRRCLHPADVGLVDANRAYACWGFPSDGDEWVRK